MDSANAGAVVAGQGAVACGYYQSIYQKCACCCAIVWLSTLIASLASLISGKAYSRYPVADKKPSSITSRMVLYFEGFLYVTTYAVIYFMDVSEKDMLPSYR